MTLTGEQVQAIAWAICITTIALGLGLIRRTLRREALWRLNRRAERTAAAMTLGRTPRQYVNTGSHAGPTWAPAWTSGPMGRWRRRP